MRFSHLPIYIHIPQELAPLLYKKSRLPGFIGPVPPPLWIRDKSQYEVVKNNIEIDYREC
ncbi:MAG: hypothetical protein K0R93_2168 [Anaerosolibacter sp.]|jgi:hypothetical protein|nr:hypothetical protein [Anaerosolibacter sp.]